MCFNPRVVGLPELSIVIPAYDEARRIGRTLDETVSYLEMHYPRFELLVVTDGSRDATAEIVDARAAEEPRLRHLGGMRGRGKGASVRRGVLASRGARVLFMDADLATPLEEIDRFLTLLDEGCDVVIGSRAHRESHIARRQPSYRERMGKTFNGLVRLLLMHDYADTQCGFKAFRRDAADAIFSRLTIERFAFDVEVLLVARDLGLRVCEAPVTWSHVPESKVSPFGDAGRMLLDLLILRARRAIR